MSEEPTTSTDDGTERCCIAEAEEDEKALLPRRPWSDLPPELLELIASCGLTQHDKTEASRVCKAWHSIFRWVQGFPWTFYYPRQGDTTDTHPDTFKLSDPTMSGTYSIHMPEELSGAIPCFAKDGWLLLYRHHTAGVFFFNPFTRHSIKLPDFEGGRKVGFFAAFSCAPTSPGCVVFIATHIVGDNNFIEIHTCHPGATQWTASTHLGGLHFPPDRELKLVVCNGLFYCLCFLGGGVGIFDPRGREWTVLEATPPAYRGRKGERKLTCWCNRTFAAEYGGEILGVHTCQGEEPRLFKLLLNQRRAVVEWKEVRSLNGASFFAGIVASHATNRIDLPPRNITNRIYLPQTHFAGKQKRCTSYSVGAVSRHRTEVFDESWEKYSIGAVSRHRTEVFDESWEKYSIGAVSRHRTEVFDESWEKAHLNKIFWIEPPQVLPSFFSIRLAQQSRKNAGDEIECLPPY